ncbi:hypothetical protein CesoFtcFv8_008833 [Champsocephalus esox]|uniref:Uncharacterized protein n=1 Tax=Champsocephalus esox TaxID=159716 RepID=A0AAN8CC91_9TELE|nr:hypothetical protein CesoFtcFv8_008833 [Champsocephalus esox]
MTGLVRESHRSALMNQLAGQLALKGLTCSLFAPPTPTQSSLAKSNPMPLPVCRPSPSPNIPEALSVVSSPVISCSDVMA